MSRPATLKVFGGFGGIGPLPSANAAIPCTHYSASADAGTYINIGGPNGPIRNQYLDPEGGTGIGVTVIGAQFGYWRSR